MRECYSEWTTEELLAKLALLSKSPRGRAENARIGRINTVLRGRDRAARKATAAAAAAGAFPEDQGEWLAGAWLDGAGPARKANALLSLVRKTFGAEWWRVFGYDHAAWSAEFSRRGAVNPETRETVRAEVARLEWQSWERTVARRVANARQPGDTHRTAAGRVALNLAEGWRRLAFDETGAQRDGIGGEAVAALDPRNGPVDPGFLAELTRAVADVTRPYLAEDMQRTVAGEGMERSDIVRLDDPDPAPPVYRKPPPPAPQKVTARRDRARSAALQEVLHALLKSEHPPD